MLPRPGIQEISTPNYNIRTGSKSYGTNMKPWKKFMEEIFSPKSFWYPEIERIEESFHLAALPGQ